MPLPILAQLGISAAVGGANYLLNKRKNPMVNPNQYRDKLLFDETDASKMRSGIGSQIMGRLLPAQSATQANIKQAGAAGRLPKGAILSSLAGANYNTARGVGDAFTNLEPKLDEMKRNSFMDFMNMQNQYNAAEEETGAFNSNLIGDTVGTLGKLAVLYNSGYFSNNPQQGQTWDPQEYKNKKLSIKL